jgi:repressor of nif and glnA expression
MIRTCGSQLPPENMEKSYMAILKVLGERETGSMSSRKIAERLKAHGVTLSERTVRYHLKVLTERGLTSVNEQGRRLVTKKGREEFSRGLASELDFVLGMMK